MKKIYFLFILSIVFAFAGLQAQNVKICSASDIHYFDPTLLIKDGTAFQTYLAQDRKLIAEGPAITASLMKEIKALKPAIFLITGDLTKDGEKISHQNFAKYLDTLESNGVTKVYVIPGNHDVNNVDACKYDGATQTKVDSVSPSDFKKIYANFGYSEAVDSDPVSLSYLAKPNRKLWILAMDVCMYDSNMVRKTPVTPGRFKADTYKWVLKHLKEAKDSGATVIGMMHHGLVEHYVGQSQAFSEYVVSGWDTISTRFADAGLKMVFTGHYHANDIVKKQGTGSNFVYDIETGSTVTWPCPFRVMYLDTLNKKFDINTKLITSINYNTNGQTFQQYAADYLNTGLTGLVNYSMALPPYSLNAATLSVVTPHVVKAFAAHYAGDEKAPASETAFISYLLSAGQTTLAYTLMSFWTDPAPSDNNVMLNLSTGTSVNGMKTEAYENFVSPAIGTYSGINVRETGGSGLFYIPGTNNEFYTLGDRGPNIDAASSAYTLVNNTTITDTKIFPFPAYQPKIMRIALRNDSVVILDMFSIKRPNGTSVSGLPNPISLGNAGEGALYENSQAAHDNPLGVDTLGIDCEGIALGTNKDLWISDEYGVSVWRVNRTTGALINRYSPFKNLPAKYNNIAIDSILSLRRPNRGFENLSITPSGKVYALLQSPMTNPDKKSRILRMLEIDPSTNKTRMFAWLLPVISGVSYKDWKTGDMVAINNNEFLVLAHGATSPVNRITIYKLNIQNATAITTEAYTVGGVSKTFEQLVSSADTSGLNASVNGKMDIVPIKSSVFLEMYNETYDAYPSAKNIWNPELDKPEGLAIVNDSTLAITHDNDFGFKSSDAADGSVTASGLSWKVFLYHLTGTQKVSNYVAPKLDQYITFPSIANHVYGDSPVKLGAAASSGLPVTYLVSNSHVTKITNDTARIIGAGSVAISVSQEGNSVYLNASAIDTLVVAKAPLMVTVENDSILQGENIPAFVLTYEGFVNGDDELDLDTQPAASTTATSTSAAGTYPIALTAGNDDNYTITPANGTLIITKVVSPVTSMGAIAENGLKVFPNPVTQTATIQSATGINQVKVYNTTGVLLQTVNGNGSQSLNIDFSSLPKGIYFITVQTAQQIVKYSVEKL